MVDENDRVVGAEEKIKAHELGSLHRAVSTFVFDAHGKLLLQKRAQAKYHSGGLWSNTCCGHPRPTESVVDAARRRLREEMGFECELQEVFTFLYRVEFENGFIEHELDHVLVGFSNPMVETELNPDPSEVEDCRWLSISELLIEIKERPERFTHWLGLAINKGLWQEVARLKPA